MIQPWPLRGSRLLGDFRIFRLRSDLKQSPRTGQPHEFIILESAPWVNVIAVTSDDQLVMIEQYRHGTNTVELEIPGGLMDATDASPIVAGERELREETGYAGERAEVLGQIHPNPAIQNNTCYTVWVHDCRRQYPVDWDQGEDLATRLIPVADLAGLVADGKIRHALVAVALYYFDLRRRQ